MKSKKYKIIRSRFLLPVSDVLGRETRIEDGYVLTEGSKILEVGKYKDSIGDSIIEKYGTELEIIGSNAPVAKGSDIPKLPGLTMPGFVKAHGHDHESPIIGVAKDEPLADWLDHAVNLFTGFMGEKREFLTDHLGISPNLVTYQKARVDDIYYGITSNMVHHCNHNKYRVPEIVEANTMAGTKMIVAMGGQDRNYDERIIDKPGEAVERLNKYLAAFKDTPRVEIIPGPDQLFSNGPEQLKSLKAWAKENDTLIHIHSSEEPRTTKWFVETYGMTPIEYANSIGFLDENTIVAHQVNNTENDLKILRDTGTKVVHNPLANTILGSGMPPVVKMMEMGIPVAISTDGSGSADHQNMIMAAKLASQYQKAFLQDAHVLPAMKVIEMTTAIPGTFLRMKAGQLRPGYDADFVYHDMQGPHLTPTRLDNLVENLVWCANGSEVEHVVSCGEILMKDKKYMTLDDTKIKASIEELSRLMMEHKKNAAEITGTGARNK